MGGVSGSQASPGMTTLRPQFSSTQGTLMNDKELEAAIERRDAAQIAAEESVARDVAAALASFDYVTEQQRQEIGKHLAPIITDIVMDALDMSRKLEEARIRAVIEEVKQWAADTATRRARPPSGSQLN